MPLTRYSRRSDSVRYWFWDDFIGTNYLNRVWSVRGTGGSAAVQLGSLIRVRATANLNYEFYHGDMPDFSVAALAESKWRFALSSTTSRVAKVGFEAASPSHTTDYITFGCDSTVGANWLCSCSNGGVATTVDTGIAADTNYHEVKIITQTGSIQFYLDGVLVAAIVTNIPSVLLQLFVYVGSSTGSTRDVNLDWVDGLGDRE